MSSNINMLKTFVEGELIKAKDTNSNNQYLYNKIMLAKAEIEGKINDISSSLTPFCVNNVTYINGKKQFLTLDVSQDEAGEDVKVLHAHAPFTFTTGNRKTINVTSDVCLDVTALQADKTYNIYCDYNDDTQVTTLVAMVNKVYKSVVQPSSLSINDIWINLQEPLSAYIKTLSTLEDTNKTLIATYKDGTISDVNAGVIRENRRIGDPIPTLSDNLPDNAIWLEGAKVAKTDYLALYNVYGDKYYITNFEDVGLISSGVQFEYSGKLTNYSSRNFIQTAEKFITNGRPWSIRFRHKTPNAFSADYSLLGNATGVNFKQAIEFDVLTTGLLRLCISSNGTSYDIVPIKIGTNKLLVDTWYDIILKFTGSAYIVTFKQVIEDAEVNNEGEWTTDLNITSTVAIYENAEDDNLLCFGNHVYATTAQLPCLGVIDFTKSHILTTSENATENYDTVFWKWTKKRDEDVDYFKLPDARNRVLWGTTESNFGYISAGLPNITGGYKHPGWSGYDYWGAVYKGYMVANTYGSGGAGTPINGMEFDASKSNSIYSSSSTVQPPSLKYRAYTYYA